MKHKIRFLTLISVGLAALSTDAVAQECVASGGSSSGSIACTIGLPFYQPMSGSSGSVTPGVQHAFTVTEVAVGDMARQSFVDIAAYPNPATDRILLRTGSQDINNINFTLTDLNGRTLKSGLADGYITEIPVSSLSPAVYLLYVREGNNHLKTFKIIKN